VKKFPKMGNVVINRKLSGIAVGLSPLGKRKSNNEATRSSKTPLPQRKFEYTIFDKNPLFTLF
jgi:hypothetical protein